MGSPPFSVDEFFHVFAAYNLAVWPVQIALGALGVVLAVLAFRGSPRTGRPVAFGLALLWVWMGVAYHWVFFTEINPAAWAFGAAFVAEGALLGWMALRPGAPAFRAEPDLYGVAGTGLIVYALALYPLLGVLVGHTYPREPTFGLPCPTTIFTVGVLLWARTRIPWGVLVVPVGWSLVATTAVRSFGMIEDTMLPVAGILGGALVLWKGRAGTPTPPLTVGAIDGPRSGSRSPASP